MDLEEQLFTTTGLGRNDSRELASACNGASAWVTASLWAMIKAGCFSTDEMLDRIASLKLMTKTPA